MFRLIFLLITLSLASAGKIKFTDCGHHETLEIRSPNCDGAECEFPILHNGKNYTLEADIIANQDSQRINIEVFAKIGGVEVQVESGVTNGCIGLGVKCPIKKGEKYTFHVGFQIPLFAPTVCFLKLQVCK